MRHVIFFIVSFWIMGAQAEECYPAFNEAGLISSTGAIPVKKEIKKENGQVKHQYFFRKEGQIEEAFDNNNKKKGEPQFYITVYDPPCAEKIIIWFYLNDDGTPNKNNVALAGKAYEYLTGTNAAIFENKLNKFNDVQHFESFNDKANAIFAKSTGFYAITIHSK
ncbi:hypothetical protein ACL2XG_05305 [Sodalis sp. RH24]|uniref:hypothetical protein n=1 Tax=unclassified Sodalis (in: enterobacteria) TaxID=2636512 RepID=UPI0039B3FDFD